MLRTKTYLPEDPILKEAKQAIADGNIQLLTSLLNETYEDTQTKHREKTVPFSLEMANMGFDDRTLSKTETITVYIRDISPKLNLKLSCGTELLKEAFRHEKIEMIALLLAFKQSGSRCSRDYDVAEWGAPDTHAYFITLFPDLFKQLLEEKISYEAASSSRMLEFGLSLNANYYDGAFDPIFHNTNTSNYYVICKALALASPRPEVFALLFDKAISDNANDLHFIKYFFEEMPKKFPLYINKFSELKLNWINSHIDEASRPSIRVLNTSLTCMPEIKNLLQENETLKNKLESSPDTNLKVWYYQNFKPLSSDDINSCSYKYHKANEYLLYEILFLKNIAPAMQLRLLDNSHQSKLLTAAKAVANTISTDWNSLRKFHSILYTIITSRNSILKHWNKNQIISHDYRLIIEIDNRLRSAANLIENPYQFFTLTGLTKTGCSYDADNMPKLANMLTDEFQYSLYEESIQRTIENFKSSIKPKNG